jgi:hypothetical protein
VAITGVQERVYWARIDRNHVADLADVDRHAVDDRRATLSGEQAGILTGQTDRERAVVVDLIDDLAVDLADEDHAHDLHCLGRGHAQAGAELRLDPEPIQVRRDLGSASVHDDGSQAGIAQEHHVLGERPLQLWRRHGIAAVLDHNDLAVKSGQPRQGVDQSARLRQSDVAVPAHVEYAEFVWT